ncbi:MAG: 6-oxocyclohex-1-ene-1-carbonyl-CoA hydratase [Polyangiaceae bacterium]|nr:6-oxocyclohex-1-ene-1-carbonyl-CoA hydratase [Polyangiaceae bacterium]
MSQPDRLPSHLVDHDVAQGATQPSSGPAVRYELKPARRPDGRVAEGLYAAWITLDNPAQYNSYTTEMAKEVVLSFRRASNARDVVAVVFTGAGDRAFCTGGNTKEYAEYYAGRPAEYAAYMRLFNDMVSAILLCDKPVICRVNGMRVGGGQEIGMACDFSVASDLANFGQAGPRHGSAPVGGSTDFLPLYVGVERAMFSVTLCQPWSAYRALNYGLITEAVPVLTVDDEVIPNPLVVSDRWLERGRVVYGDFKTGAEAAAGKDLLKRGVTDLRPLDAAVERLVSSLLMTFPGCVEKTVSEIRKHKLAHWDANKESNRAWLALNMLSEANAGFRAFNEGPKDDREADFVLLRQRIAKGEAWSDELIEAILPKGRGDRAGK